ncbi:MAG: glycosyltransferase family 2 protein [Candidatus Hodarchaeales archaeon]
MMNESVCAFIIVRDEKDSILNTVEGLLNQTHELCRIVIVDDGSTNGTHDIVEKIVVENERVDMTTLPYHEDSYVGRWELGRSINFGLREIQLLHGIPDWILQMGADHVLPVNYVETLLSGMSDTIRIASGTYLNAKLNVDTPIGSGKLIDAKLWWEFNKMVYPEKYGYESWIDYRFRMEGYAVRRDDSLITDCRPVRMNKRKAFYWGKCTYALGGILPFALIRSVTFLKKYMFNFLKGYYSRDDVEIHEDIFNYVGKMQYEKLMKTLHL